MELLFNNVLLACQLCLGLWQFSKLTPVGALIQGVIGWLLRPLGLSPVYSCLQHCRGRVFKKANCFALEADIPSERRDIVSCEVNTIKLHYLGREYVLERKGEDSNMLYIDQEMCYYITHRIWKELQNLEQVLRYGLESLPLAPAVVTRAAANRAEAHAERAEADARSAELDAERAESMARDAGAEAEHAAAEAERAEAEAERAKAEHRKAEAEAERAEAEAERAKAEYGKAKADVQRAEAEAERATAEHGKAEAEAERAEAEAERAEAKHGKAEAEAEAERAEAEAERAKAEHGKAKAKRADAEHRKAEDKAKAEAEHANAEYWKAEDEAFALAMAKAMAVAEAESKAEAEAKEAKAKSKSKAALAEFAGSIARSAATRADEAMQAAKPYRAAADNASLAARATTDSAANKAALAADARARIPALRAAAAEARADASAACSAAAARTATDTADTTLFVKGKKEFWKEVITGGVMTFKEVSDAIILYNQHVSRRISNDWLLPVNLSVSEEKLLKIFNLVALFLQTKKANVHWLIPTALSFISALLEFSTGLRVWFYTKINELFCFIMHFICDPLPRSWRQQVYSMGMWVEDLTPSNDILVKVVRGNMCAIITECLKIDIKGPVLVVKIKPCSDVEWPDNMYTVITPSAKIDREGPILVPWLETDLTPDYGVIEKQFRCYPIDIIIRCSYVIEHELCEISAPTICVFSVKCKSTEDFKHIVTLIACVAENCCGSLIYYGPNNKVRVRGFKESITSYVNNGFPPIYKLELENVVIV